MKEPIDLSRSKLFNFWNDYKRSTDISLSDSWKTELKAIIKEYEKKLQWLIAYSIINNQVN